MKVITSRYCSRDLSFDLARAIAIFMVIYWHVMSYRYGFDLMAMPSLATNFIIAVNMPLFFMVSGYFSRQLHYSSSWGRLGNRLISYFWPMAVFALLFTCIDAIGFRKFQMSQIPLRTLKNFLFADWFFHALAICDGITFMACLCKRYWLRVLICALGFVICLVGSGRLWYVGSVVQMIFFYWFGFYGLPKILNRRYILTGMALLGGIVLIVVTYFYGNIATNGLSFYWDRFDVFQPQIDKVVNMVMRFCVGVLGSLFIVWILRIGIKLFPWLVRLAFLGRETLGIYFLQGGMIGYLVVPFVGLDAGVEVLLLTSIGIFLLTFLIVKALKINEYVSSVMYGCKIFGQSAQSRKINIPSNI